MAARTVSELFALSCRRAILDLPAADLATLASMRPGGGAARLGWVPVHQLTEVIDQLRRLATRPNELAWRLSKSELRYLLGLLGVTSTAPAPREAFCLALEIDACFASVDAGGEEDARRLAREGVVAQVRSFFADATNLPPALGQMTARAIVRRWFSKLWLAGSTDRLDVFGRPLELRGRPASGVLAQRLADARRVNELRVSVVTWRRHSGFTFGQSPAGCFSILGTTPAARPGLVSDVVEELRRTRAHIGVLPELALTTDDFSALRGALSEKAAKYPALVVAGLAHRAAGAAHVNEAVVLDGSGRVVLSHAKLEPFTDRALGIEDIVPRASTDYSFLDTPVGRIVINICRDYRSDQPMLLNRLLDATLLIVPSYSARLEYVAAEAPVLGQRQLAATIAVNPTHSELDDAAFVYAPVRGCVGLRVRQVDLPSASHLTVLTFSMKSAPGRPGQVHASEAVAV